MHLKEMTDGECVEFLAGHVFGHLACKGERYPYVVPINYAYEARKIFMFSMPGQKINQLRAHSYGGLQVEELQKDRIWTSVLVQGSFDELPDTPARRDERIHAWSLLEKRPFWWEPGSFDVTSGDKSPDGPIFFSLSIDMISGRHTSQ